MIIALRKTPGAVRGADAVKDAGDEVKGEVKKKTVGGEAEYYKIYNKLLLMLGI